MLYREIISEARHPLSQLRVNDIDLDAAARHFDLPIADQFASHRSLLRGLQDTKRAMLALFANEAQITVYRALDVAVQNLNTEDIGIAWAWDLDGALLGSSLGDRQGIIVIGKVSAEGVDWATTVAVNTFREDEQEIVLRDGATVQIEQVVTVAGRRLGADVTPDGLRNQSVTV
jgi:hypothetical protein